MASVQSGLVYRGSFIVAIFSLPWPMLNKPDCMDAVNDEY
jgi:hypothetical protein